MKNKELKTLWKLAKSFWIAGLLFWSVETIIFLIIEGWHWKATNPTEIWCDNAVSSIWTFALNLTIVTCGYFLININRKRKRSNVL
jgi:hypothetical protein